MMRVFVSALCVVTLASASAAAQTPAEWQDVIRNLRNPSPQARLAAVERLGKAGYVPAAEAVSALIADPDDRVQLAAIDAELTFYLSDALGGGGWSSGGGGGRTRAQQAYEAGVLRRSAAAPPSVLIDRLIAAMRDENPRVRFDAVHALGFIADAPLAPAQAKLLGLEMDHYDWIIRAATARVIGRLRASAAADPLAVALGDSNPNVRLYATESLGLLRDARSAVTFREKLGQARGDMIAATVQALARIGSRDDVGLFRQRAADKVPALRRAAAEGLGRAGDKDSIPLLENLFKTDKAADVRLAAAFALQLLGQVQSHVIASNLVLDSVGAQARDYLLELGAAAVPGIQSALKVATEPRHRADLAAVLGYVGGRDDVPLAEPLLQDRDEHVRRAATQAIARLRR